MGAPLGQTTEALCNVTVTRLDPSPLAGRDGVAVYNGGPEVMGIYVTTASSPTFTLGTAIKVDPEDTWGPYPLADNVHIFGITTALQVAGAASIVTEYGGNVLNNYSTLAGGAYSALLSKASGANFDWQYASYWTDVACSLTAGGTSATDISPAMRPFIGNIQMPAFSGGSSSALESLYVSLQMPHGWDAGTDIYPHLHIARGLAGSTNAYGTLPINSNGVPAASGTYNYVAATGYITSGNVTSLTQFGGKDYAMYYNASKNYTCIFYQSAGIYIACSGNWTTSGGHGTLTYYSLTGNVGSNTSSTFWVPSPLTGSTTYNTFTLGPYQATGATGDCYFNFEYTWCNVGSPPKTDATGHAEFPNSAVLAATMTVSTRSYEHMMIEFGAISGAGMLRSSVLLGRVTRIPSNVLDTYNDYLWGLSFDVHAQMLGTGYGPTQYSGA